MNLHKYNFCNIITGMDINCGQQLLGLALRVNPFFFMKSSPGNIGRYHNIVSLFKRSIVRY